MTSHQVPAGLPRWLSWLDRPQALLWLLALAFVLHVGGLLTGGLYADDFIQAALFLGSDRLAELGLLNHVNVGEFSSVQAHQFNFFDPASSNYQALRDFGILPWWTSDQALLHFYRPLASLTHYLDYQLWPNSSIAMHAINMLWYISGLAIIYRCFLTLGLTQSVSRLALLLIILDHSVFQVVTWIAARNALMVVALGFACLTFYHMACQAWQDNRHRLFAGYYLISLLLLLLTMLTGEAVITICAYLGAYMLVFDRRQWWQRVISLLPFAVLIIIWRLLYQQAGFGASGVDFYLDPGRDPLAFLSLAQTKVWLSFFELFSAIDVMSGQIRPDIRMLLGIPGALLFLGFTYLVVKAYRQQQLSKAALCLYLGSCMALLPGLAIALSPRVMIIPFIGLAAVLAELLLINRTTIGLWLTRCYVYIVHILISFALAFWVLTTSIADTFNSLQSKTGVQHEQRVKLGENDYADKHLVVMSTAKPFWLSFIAHELDYFQLPLPKTSRVLTTNWFPMTVSRLSEQQFVIEAKPAFQFDAAMLEGVDTHYHLHYAFLNQQLLGLMKSSRDQWWLGQQFELPEMQIAVQKLYSKNQANAKPSSLLITLKQPLRDYDFIIWSMSRQRYVDFRLPDIGESIQLPGLFSP
ncbi:MAG: hypothetical protein HRU21_05100 [Pseudomonadales bacterium]|nr:hypothetical protein [Pseudomonadales bacterium]